jgi:HEAT repeat protein
VVHGRAEDLQQVGQAYVLTLTRLADLKGTAPASLRVLVRADWQDVKAGDEFVAFVRAVDGEALGLGAGTYFASLTSPHFALIRVTDQNRAAWLERVRVHAAGATDAVVHRCAADVTSADVRLAGDALVDLWHHRMLDLAGMLSSQEKATIASAVLAETGWDRLRDERVHGIMVLGIAKALEGYSQLLARLDRDAQPDELHPDLAWTIGEALGQIDRAQAAQDLAAKLAGTPERPAVAETQLRVLGALRGMAAPETLPAVQALFTHADAAVRRWAMVTSGYVGAEPARAALVARCEGGNGLDAWCAAFALHRTGGDEGWAEVKRLAQVHGDPETREWLERFVQNPAMRGQDVMVKLVRGY